MKYLLTLISIISFIFCNELVIIIMGIFPNIFLEPMRLPIEIIINNYEIANAK